MRGGAAVRGRGGASQIYQARGGAGGQGAQSGRGGRGRGGAPGGGMNAHAPPYSPTGQAGVKRGREDGLVGGGGQQHGTKRPRGG